MPIWPKPSIKCKMPSAISEKCQRLTATERFKSNPSKALLRVKWEVMEKCTPRKLNLETKFNAIMVNANKLNAKMVNAKREKSMHPINKTHNNPRPTDLASTTQMEPQWSNRIKVKPQKETMAKI